MENVCDPLIVSHNGMALIDKEIDVLFVSISSKTSLLCGGKDLGDEKSSEKLRAFIA